MAETLITAAGIDPRVAGLVYIAALAPDAGETSQSPQSKFPVADIFSHIEVADGRVWMQPQALRALRGPVRTGTAGRLGDPSRSRRGPIQPEG